MTVSGMAIEAGNVTETGGLIYVAELAELLGINRATLKDALKSAESDIPDFSVRVLRETKYRRAMYVRWMRGEIDQEGMPV